MMAGIMHVNVTSKFLEDKILKDKILENLRWKNKPA